MMPGFFDVVKPDGAGCTGRTVKTSGFAMAKKTKSELLIFADAGHYLVQPQEGRQCDGWGNFNGRKYEA